MILCERAGSDPHYHFPILLDSSRFEDFRSKDRDINSNPNSLLAFHNTIFTVEMVMQWN